MNTLQSEFILSVDNEEPLIILEVSALDHIQHDGCSISDNCLMIDLESGKRVSIGPLSDIQLSMVIGRKMPFILMNTALNSILDVQLIHVRES
jgi:hypothetical protein